MTRLLLLLLALTFPLSLMSTAKQDYLGTDWSTSDYLKDDYGSLSIAGYSSQGSSRIITAGLSNLLTTTSIFSTYTVSQPKDLGQFATIALDMYTSSTLNTPPLATWVKSTWNTTASLSNSLLRQSSAASLMREYPPTNLKMVLPSYSKSAISYFPTAQTTFNTTMVDKHLRDVGFSIDSEFGMRTLALDTIDLGFTLTSSALTAGGLNDVAWKAASAVVGGTSSIASGLLQESSPLQCLAKTLGIANSSTSFALAPSASSLANFLGKPVVDYVTSQPISMSRFFDFSVSNGSSYANISGSVEASFIPNHDFYTPSPWSARYTSSAYTLTTSQGDVSLLTNLNTPRWKGPTVSLPMQTSYAWPTTSSNYTIPTSAYSFSFENTALTSPSLKLSGLLTTNCVNNTSIYRPSVMTIYPGTNSLTFPYSYNRGGQGTYGVSLPCASTYNTQRSNTYAQPEDPTSPKY